MAVDLVHVNKMVSLANKHGFTVTSTTGGQHNVGSKHGKGLAIDVRTRDKTNLEVDSFIKIMRSEGYKVIDERIKPAGQKVWSGPHLHIEVLNITEKIKEEFVNKRHWVGVFFLALIIVVVIYIFLRKNK